jgi:hypothetical protein
MEIITNNTIIAIIELSRFFCVRGSVGTELPTTSFILVLIKDYDLKAAIFPLLFITHSLRLQPFACFQYNNFIVVVGDIFFNSLAEIFPTVACVRVYRLINYIRLSRSLVLPSSDTGDGSAFQPRIIRRQPNFAKRFFPEALSEKCVPLLPASACLHSKVSWFSHLLFKSTAQGLFRHFSFNSTGHIKAVHFLVECGLLLESGFRPFEPFQSSQ